MENAVYLSEALFDVINAIEVNENSGDPSTVITSIERAYRMLVQVENNNFNRDRYGAFSSVTEEHGENFFGDPPPVAKKIFRTYHNFSGNTYDVYCHCRCLFIVIPYHRININHDRINLNLVGPLGDP
jgi:hypothetical protein